MMFIVTIPSSFAVWKAPNILFYKYFSFRVA